MTQRDPRWDRVSGGIEPRDEWGRKITIEVRGAGPHKVGFSFILSEHDEPYFGAVMDRIVRELDKAIHA